MLNDSLAPYFTAHLSPPHPFVSIDPERVAHPVAFPLHAQRQPRPLLQRLLLRPRGRHPPARDALARRGWGAGPDIAAGGGDQQGWDGGVLRHCSYVRAHRLATALRNKAPRLPRLRLTCTITGSPPPYHTERRAAPLPPPSSVAQWKELLASPLTRPTCTTPAFLWPVASAACALSASLATPSRPTSRPDSFALRCYLRRTIRSPPPTFSWDKLGSPASLTAHPPCPSQPRQRGPEPSAAGPSLLHPEAPRSMGLPRTSSGGAIPPRAVQRLRTGDCPVALDPSLPHSALGGRLGASKLVSCPTHTAMVYPGF
jgi:hypothetical protein